MKTNLLILFVSYLIISCSQSDKDKGSTQSTNVNPTLTFEEISSPAGENASFPDLFSSHAGKIYMSWLETGEELTQLFYSTYFDEKWSEPILIANGKDWFVNWADFPVIAASKSGSVLTHFLAKSAPDTYAYNINLVFSTDDGINWGDPFIPHKDQTQTEHGFVSIQPMPDGSFFIAWLDGRNTLEENGAMTIRGGFIDAEGNFLESVSLDERVCDCCQTGVALTDNGPIVVYRDRSEEEIRDMSIVRWVDGQWTMPKIIYGDGWKIAGCPVNGPKVDALGNYVAVTWFSGANNDPKVNIAFSEDGGATFSAPVRVDDGSTIGRIDMVMITENQAWVTWLESTDNDTEIRARSINSNGEKGPSIKIASTKKDRSSGFPQVVKVNNKLLFAYTSQDGTTTVKTGFLPLN